MIHPPDYGPPIALGLAKQVMAAAESLAEREDWAVAIAIVDSTGHIVMLHRRDQTQYASIEGSLEKALTALNFRRATSTFQEAIGNGVLRLLSVRNLTAIQGGVLLLSAGQVVGAIGVSGVEGSEDTRVALEGASALDG